MKQHQRAPDGARGFVLVLVLVLLLDAEAATIGENFATNPLAHGWRIFGQTNLFIWNATNQNLSITWDSSQPNSYFYIPLGTIVNRCDDFSISLDLQLADITPGANPAKPYTFEMAVGFLNLINATNANFLRGNGGASPNLVEFDYFPGDAATIWPSIWSTNSVLNYNSPSDYTLITLPLGVVMRVTMSYTASNQTLVTTISTNNVSIGQIHTVTNSARFTDFRTGAFAIESYSDVGQNNGDQGSLLAHGTVGNILITIPPPPVQNLTGKFVGNTWQVAFISRTNWIYTLERSADLRSWTSASPTANGNGTVLVMQDTNALMGKSFYRVRAEKP